MPRAQLTNFAKATLAAPITTSSSSLTLGAGQGALFPASGYFYLTVIDDSNIPEQILCGARTGDVCSSLTRGQEGTSARAFGAGAVVRLTASAAVLNELAAKGDANAWTAPQTPPKDTAAVSATSTYTFDGASQVREITLTNAITVTFGAPTGISEGAFYCFKLKAGDTNARTFAWNAAYKFPSASPPLASGSTTSGGKDIITFVGGPTNTL